MTDSKSDSVERKVTPTRSKSRDRSRDRSSRRDRSRERSGRSNRRRSRSRSRDRRRDRSHSRDKSNSRRYDRRRSRSPRGRRRPRSPSPQYRGGRGAGRGGFGRGRGGRGGWNGDRGGRDEGRDNWGRDDPYGFNGQSKSGGGNDDLSAYGFSAPPTDRRGGHGDRGGRSNDDRGDSRRQSGWHSDHSRERGSSNQSQEWPGFRGRVPDGLEMTATINVAALKGIDEFERNGAPGGHGRTASSSRPDYRSRNSPPRDQYNDRRGRDTSDSYGNEKRNFERGPPETKNDYGRGRGDDRGRDGRNDSHRGGYGEDRYGYGQNNQGDRGYGQDDRGQPSGHQINQNGRDPRSRDPRDDPRSSQGSDPRGLDPRASSRSDPRSDPRSLDPRGPPPSRAPTGPPPGHHDYSRPPPSLPNDSQEKYDPLNPTRDQGYQSSSQSNPYGSSESRYGSNPYGEPKEANRAPPSRTTDEDYRIRNEVRSNLDPRNRSLSGNDPRKPPEHRSPPKDEYIPSTIDKYLKSSMSKDEVLAKLKSDLFDQKKSDHTPPEKPPMISQQPRDAPPSKLPPRRMFGNSQEVIYFVQESF